MNGHNLELATMLGNYLKERRQKLGLTQQSLALQLNCSPQYYNKIERGHSTVSGEMLSQLVDYLDLRLDVIERIHYLASTIYVHRIFHSDDMTDAGPG